MTKSCVKIWVDKIKGDYERYGKAVSDEMSQASSKLSESIQGKCLHTCAHYGLPIHLDPNFPSIHIFACNLYFLVREVIMHSLKSTAAVIV